MKTWQVVHEELVGIARRRAAMDVEEARWIRRGLEGEVWNGFGMVGMVDYLERVLGYAPRTAMDRVRVAVELRYLKKIERAMEQGEIGFSVAREIVRVATTDTEREWVDAVKGMNVKQVEDAVRGRQKGARPTDPEEPEVVARRVVVEVPPEVFARWRQVCAEASGDSGRRLADGEVFALMCEAALGGGGVETPRSQVAITVCEKCRQGWQHGGGAAIAIGEAALECARCDALEIGSIDGNVVERAAATITPAIRRFVWHRDGGRCRVPGCRSTKHIDIHHLIHQASGESTNDPNYLILACHSCHVAHHEGRICISGTSDDLRVSRPQWDELCHGTSGATLIRTGRPSDADTAHVGTADRDQGPSRPPDASALGAKPARDRGIRESGPPLDVDAGNANRARGMWKGDPPLGGIEAHVGNADDRRHAKDRHGQRRVHASVCSDAVLALVTSGFSRTMSRAAVDAAIDEGARELEPLIRAALRHCR